MNAKEKELTLEMHKILTVLVYSAHDPKKYYQAINSAVKVLMKVDKIIKSEKNWGILWLNGLNDFSE